jgi:hypothetical protein
MSNMLNPFLNLSGYNISARTAQKTPFIVVFRSFPWERVCLQRRYPVTAAYTCLLRICCLAANVVSLFVSRSLPVTGLHITIFWTQFRNSKIQGASENEMHLNYHNISKSARMTRVNKYKQAWKSVLRFLVHAYLFSTWVLCPLLSLILL